jgi:hypothetical protein
MRVMDYCCCDYISTKKGRGMKRILLSAVFFLIMAGISFGAELNINISQSTLELRGTDTFRAHKIVAQGFVGAYWVDFKWDPVNFVFVPVAGGQEANATAVTWELSPYHEGYIVTLTSDPSHKTFRVSFAVEEGNNSASVCPGYGGFTFIQLNAGRFNLAQYSFELGPSNAMVQWDQSWFSGCGTIYEGEVVSGTISNIPSWFSFADPFMLNTFLDEITLEPDGTYHR